MKKAVIGLMVIGFLILIPAQVGASMENDEILWTENGAQVQYTESQSPGPHIVTDDQNGGIFVFSAQGNIYVQRIDSSGLVQWADDGVVIESLDGSSRSPQIVSDGNGGVIVAWDDRRTATGNSDYPFHVYAQLINSEGEVQWTENGIAISTSSGNESAPTIISDNSGGALIFWVDSDQIYANHINNFGSILWGNNGKSIESLSQTYGITDSLNLQVVHDGQGGFFLVWEHEKEVYALRCTGEGETLWDSPVKLMEVGKLWYEKKNVAVIGSYLYVLMKKGSSYYDNYGDIYIQKVHFNGNTLWGENGKLISNTSENMHEEMTADGQGGIVVSWVSFNGTIHKIYSQRIDQSGNLKWGSDGIGIFDISYAHYAPNLLPDGKGNIYFTTYASTGLQPMASDMYIQKVDINGELLWGEAGYLLATGDLSQFRYETASDGNNGIIIVWEDERNHYTNPGYNHDIFAQRITPIEVVNGNNKVVPSSESNWYDWLVNFWYFIIPALGIIITSIVLIKRTRRPNR